MPPRAPGVAVGVFAAAIVVGAVSDPSHAQTDENTRFCSDAAPNVVALLDVTTPYDEADKTSLIEGISRIFEGLEDGARLSIRTIEDKSTSSQRLIQLCIPYCPDEGFFGGLLSKCTEGVVINERKHRRLQVSQALIQATRDRAELPHSAIIRTIAIVAAEEFAQGRENRFYLFSDMIENSDYLSGKDFSRTPNDTLIDQLEKDRLIPNLSGAAVKVFGVGRGGSAERSPLSQERLTKLHDFWTRFFAAGGASVTLTQNFGLSD
jgi:hypothetical protein